MAKHSSATAHSDTPHVPETSVLELSRTNTIINALKRRALAVLHDESLDAQSRAIIRYGLETNDPWLAELVRRAEASESIVDTFHCGRTLDSTEINSKPGTSEGDLRTETNAFEQSGSNGVSTNEKIEALAEIICRAGDRSAAALFVLMGVIEESTDPKGLANTAKHLAFTRCGESNIFGIVDAQRAVIEGKLLRL